MEVVVVLNKEKDVTIICDSHELGKDNELILKKDGIVKSIFWQYAGFVQLAEREF